MGGGEGWNVMKWLEIMHTIMCIIWIFYAMTVVTNVSGQAGSYSEEVRAAIGVGLGIFMIMMVWFLVYLVRWF